MASRRKPSDHRCGAGGPLLSRWGDWVTWLSVICLVVEAEPGTRVSRPTDQSFALCLEGFLGVCVFSFLSVPGSMWNLSSPARDLTCAPCSGSVSHNNWITRKAPFSFISFCFFSHLSLYLQTLVWWWWKTYLPTRKHSCIFHCWWKTPVRSSSTHLSLNVELCVSLNKNSMTKVMTELHPSY